VTAADTGRRDQLADVHHAVTDSDLTQLVPAPVEDPRSVIGEDNRQHRLGTLPGNPDQRTSR
jgi:hypothetical protein